MPTAVASVDSDTGAAPFSPNFSWSGSSDNGVSVVRTWSWDDGSSDTVDPAPTTSHTFTDPGTYTVTLTIEDSSGTDTDTLTITVTAGNTPPVAVAAVTGGVTSGDAPFAVVFDGTGSSDADGTIASYAWDFDDGGTSTSSTPSHTFIDPGTYTVTLTVTDDDGATDTDTVTITVTTGDGCDETYTATELIDALDYPYSWSWTGTPPTPILGTPSDAIGGTWSEPAHTGGYVEADAVFSGPYTALTGSHIDISVTIELTAGTAPSGGAGIVAGVGTQAHVAVNRQIRAYEYAFPPFTAPITLTAHYDIPAGDYDAFFAYLNLPMSDGVEFDVSDFVATLCLVTEPHISGGFTADLVEVGGGWTFDATASYSGATSPTISPTWDASLGTTASITINGTSAGTISSGDSIDISGETTPVTIVITGTAASADASAALTLVLADGTPLDAVTDTIEITDLLPPDFATTGIGLELYLIDDTDTPAWVELIENDYGVTGPISTARTCSIQGPYYRQQPGSLRFTLDNGAQGEADAGQWSPENESSPWRLDGQTLLRPGLPARIALTPPGSDTSYQIWTGRVTDWPPDYLSFLSSSVEVQCSDAVDRLQAADLPALTEAAGAGDSAAVRIQRILNRVGYTLFDLDPTTWNTMLATTMERAAWDEILLTSDSDGGFVWIDPLGQVRYLPRDFHVGVGPAIVFSQLGPDDADYDSTDLEFTDQDSTNDTRQLLNVIKLAPTNGVEQAATADSLDPADFEGIRAFSRSDLICQGNRQAMDLALWQIGLTRTTDFRFSKVRIDLFDVTPLAAWEAVLGLDLFQKARVKLLTPDGRSLVRDHLITGISWTLNPRQSIYQVALDLALCPPDWPLFAITGTGDSGEFTLPQTAPWY